MNPNSLKNLRARATAPPRLCNCCGEAKLLRLFSKSSPTCKDCGAWLLLFRRVFGRPRNLLEIRAYVRARKLRTRFYKKLYTQPRKQTEFQLQSIWR